MKRKLLKQIATEWRSNLWLGIELMLISTILFYIFDLTVSNLRMKRTYIGVDCTNVYRLDMGSREESSPLYEKPVAQTGESQEDAARRVAKESFSTKLRQIRELPGVIAAAPGSNAPYNYNFSGTAFHFTGNVPDSLKKLDLYANSYYVDPDYPIVFNIHGVNGESPEQLSKMLNEGKIVISSNTFKEDETGIRQENLINMALTTATEESEGATYMIGALIEPIRRGDYEMPFAGTALQPSPGMFSTIYVRLQKGFEDDFVNAITDSDSPLNKGNSYFIEAKPFSTIRNDLHRNDDAQLRNMVICMGFLLLTVFLGLLGSFWFRTQQRVREIALRKTTGASNSQIFRRLMGEGLLVLLIATVPAFGLDALLLHVGMVISASMFPQYDPWITIVIEALIIFAMMAVMIVAGIYFPARKAMKVEPAEVLRGE